MLPIIRYRFISFFISGTLCAASLVALLVYGLKPGIDFTGGSLLEVQFRDLVRPTIGDIQETIQPLNFGSVSVQLSDADRVLIRLRFLSEAEHQQLIAALRDKFASGNADAESPVVVDSRGEFTAAVGVKAVGEQAETKPSVLEIRFETIGGSLSKQLRQRSWSVAIAVVTAISVYIAYTFRRVSRPVASWKYGVVAIVTLLHDVLIPAGVFALLGRFRGVEIDIPFLVALLTIMGYSINDTIVIFDRIRENLTRGGADNFSETVNRGVNQSITRSLNTSFTTLLVLLTLYFFSRGSVQNFSLAMIIGVIVGSYSSIFLASPLLVVWESWSRRRRFR